MDENTSHITFMSTVLDRAECRKHHVPVGIPCFHIPSSSGFGYKGGICNKRALRAGFVGVISEKALRTSARAR